MAKGMILAAGQGTRVRPLTKDWPKPMVPILGKPVMEYLVEHLVHYGITDIMVNVAYHHRKIEEYFGDGRRWGANIGYAFEGMNDHGDIVPKPKGSAGGMKAIQEFSGFFDETTLVLCGDAIVDLDLGAALFEHTQKGAVASVIGLEVPEDQVHNYGIVVSDADGRVQSFQEKPKASEAKSNLASTGIYIFEPEVLDLVPSGVAFDIGSELFPLMAESEMPFYVQNRFFNWIDIGRVTDYWSVLQRVLKGEVAQMDMPGKEIKPGIWVGPNTRINWDSAKIVGPVYIGSSVQIDAGCSVIGPAWIGHGSHLRAEAKVIRSVLFEYTRIGEGMTFDEMIVSPRYCVNRKGQTTYVGDDRTELRWGDARG
ncbi:MAG TPA: NDP-sugar synthase [Rhodocyclaceae bacterium]|nr:NDP-sugar synthase [Rhodocyclaceae bacterium]